MGSLSSKVTVRDNQTVIVLDMRDQTSSSDEARPTANAGEILRCDMHLDVPSVCKLTLSYRMFYSYLLDVQRLPALASEVHVADRTANVLG